MVTLRLAPVLHYLRQVRAESADGQTDAHLLERFVESGDEAAFATLLQRHGPMVFGLCRRLLRNRHDAEDAFQATFLLLVRKARSLRQPELLGNWLYGVAYRTALKAKALLFRRVVHETKIYDVAAPSSDDVVWRDLRPVLDDAINDLPTRYRVPVVLCYLQGLTQVQAARAMGCPEGTVATRLARARQRLRRRLAKHGLGLAAGTMALGVWSSAASARLPALLLVSTVRIATALRVGKTLGASVIPAKVAALTEGVSKAMFMTKLRMVLATGILVVAIVGGTGAWTFGAMGSEPGGTESPPVAAQLAPPAVVTPQPVVRGVAAPPVVEKDYPVAVVRTENFEVYAPSRRVAQLIGEAAERFRKSEATRWLGKELPAWPGRCYLRITLTDAGAGGATSFEFDQGKVVSRKMQLEGSLDRILSGCLPHEITHTILADHFRAPIPRWADEGAAVLAEDEEEQQRHAQLMGQLLDNRKRLIPLSRLLQTKDFPPDVMCLYCEGYSLTRFLVERKDRKTFLEFVQHGMTAKSWDKSVSKYYGFDDVDALEEAWLAEVKQAAKAQSADEKRPVVTSAAPVIGRAQVADDGLLTLRSPTIQYEPKTKYVKNARGDEEPAVTTYELKAGEQIAGLEPKQYRVTDLDGKAIGAKALGKMLQKETAVLIAFDGKKVDPYYLQVVKEGTIIIMVTAKEPVPVRPPTPRDTEPPAIQSNPAPH